VRLHLDTDFAGDTDDAAALAMLLGWPGAEVVGVTTTADPGGWRSGYVHRLLELAGRDDVPIVSGASTSFNGRTMGDLPDHRRYWGDDPVTPRPSPRGAAAELLMSSVDSGASLVAIGPYTNLAAIEEASPGIMATCVVTLMGGWVDPPGADLPRWGPEMDWNIQCDTTAAQRVFEAAHDAVLVTVPATLRAHLRRADLARLEASGPIGRLLARQARAHGADHRMSELGRAHTGLPDDLLNFQYDPVACAVALGWPDVTMATIGLTPTLEDQELRLVRADDNRGAKPFRVVLDVDGAAFSDTWLTAVERAESS
jgi:purine nucleosidase